MSSAIRYLSLVGLVLLMACGSSTQDPNLFGIYTATLGGANVRRIVASASQEMTHPRVSPDLSWVAFTRYNDRGWDGTATEDKGYGNTEIAICRIDGSAMETVVPGRRGAVNSNPTWVDDGASLIWVTTDTPDQIPQIWKIELRTRHRSRVPTPAGVAASDPDQVGNTLVFPVKKAGAFDTIYSMNADGTDVKQISRPSFSDEVERGKFNLGDYDPKLSPDGTRVAFMRLFGVQGWRIFVANTMTGEEHDLSGSDVIDGLPEWSSDGERLLFRHVNLSKMNETGVYSMKPDGSERRMAPLPRGFLHNHPRFWPGAGSSQNAGIIYVARHNPELP
jgi:Tol biopolymer transport system component